MPSNKIISDLEALAHQWNNAGIAYGVAHGLENYPAKLGRDIDIIVQKNEIRKIVRLSIEFLKSLGYTVTVPPNAWGAEWLFAFKENQCLEIDFIPGLAWGPVQLVNKPEASGQVGPFKIDQWATFAKSVLMKLLGNTIPPTPDYYLETEVVSNKLLQLFGSDIRDFIISNLRSLDERKIKKIGEELRKRITFHTLLHFPVKAVMRIIPWISNEVKPHFNRTAPIIALVGPDGCGKTTITNNVKLNLPSIFLGLEVNHWRPGVFPTPAELLGRPPKKPGANGMIVPGRKPGNFHWLRLLYYFIDFYIGNYVKDCYKSSTLRVVLYDRCALDMWIDPYRYALRSKAGLNLFLKLVPKPDKILFIYDTPERIHARKPELSAEEIQTQNDTWLEMASNGKIDCVLDAQLGPETLAVKVVEQILETFIEKSLYSVL